MNQRETEIKLQVEDVRSALDLLESQRASVSQPRHFEENIVFDTQDSRLRESGMLLRVRIVNSQAILTFKGKVLLSDGVRDRQEIECTADSPGALVQILERLGYIAMFRYQKYRTVYSLEGYTLQICVDETPIGVYFELEGDIPEIHRCAEKLGFARSRYILESYGALYSRWCRERNIPPTHMTFA